jgi:hypothetical protein
LTAFCDLEGGGASAAAMIFLYTLGMDCSRAMITLTAVAVGLPLDFTRYGCIGDGEGDRGGERDREMDEIWGSELERDRERPQQSEEPR